MHFLKPCTCIYIDHSARGTEWTRERDRKHREVSRQPSLSIYDIDHNIVALAVNLWIPTTAARVRPQVTYCGICSGHSGGTGACLLRVHRFPLPILTSLKAPYPSVARGCYSTPISARRTKWRQYHPTK
jgi:hypothetical protein